MQKTPRKTLSFEDLVKEVNRRNKESICSKEVRQGWNSLVEAMLHKYQRYQGFGYYNQLCVPKNQLPGVNYEIDEHLGLVPCKDKEKRFANTDETRIFFYL